MTDRLDSKSRTDLIAYKFEKANTILEEAGLLASSGYYNAAMNRLYYAAYNAASALMLHESLEAVSHKWIKMMIGLKFIQSGRMSQEYGRIYQRLFDCRQSADYEDFVYYDKQSFQELLREAERFISEARKLIY